eukprot:SAG31_NODE_12290_length_952_cov_1.144197_1_plen_316_part_11
MAEGGGWRPTAWLGIITAGLLWTPIHDTASITVSLDVMCSRVVEISRASSTVSRDDAVAIPSTSSQEPVKADLDSVKGELQSLRRVIAWDDGQAKRKPKEPGALAELPAEIPILPAAFRKSAEMEELKRTLLSPESGARVGFAGIGGSGKTVTSAWTCHDEDVRTHFDIITWVSFGQDPVTTKLQGLLFLQLTGKELRMDYTTEQKKQALKDAFKGKKALLVLDDLWVLGHEELLNFVDSRAGGRALISSRVHSLLRNEFSTLIEVKLPSTEEAVCILMRSAMGSRYDESVAPPPEAREIVKMCGRLPLALDIAGC